MTQNQNAKIIALVVSATLVTGILLTSIWIFVFNKETSTNGSVIRQTAQTEATSDQITPDYTTKLNLARTTVAAIFSSAEQYKTEWKKYPSTLDEILNVGIIKREEVVSQNGIVYTYEVSEDGKDCAVRTTIDANQPLTSYCTTYSKMNDGVYAPTPSEQQQATESAKKTP